MRVIIAEDQVLLREGLARLFADAGHDVVGMAGDGAGLLSMAAALAPDLAVVDVRMPPTYTDEGIRAGSWRCSSPACSASPAAGCCPARRGRPPW